MKRGILNMAAVAVAGGMIALGEPEQKGEGGAPEPGKVDGKGEEAGWVSLVPEEGMGAWKGLNFGGEGETSWKDGVLSIKDGAILSGVVWEGKLPEAPYEIELEARRTSGVDFFCGLTFPVRGKESCVTLVVGGWGGGVVGISSIDGMDASENETSAFRSFRDDQWYKIRVLVQTNKLEAWIDADRVVEVDTTGRKLGLRFGDIDKCAPLGLATFQTAAEVRGLRWRPMKAAE